MTRRISAKSGVLLALTLLLGLTLVGEAAGSQAPQAPSTEQRRSASEQAPPPQASPALAAPEARSADVAPQGAVLPSEAPAFVPWRVAARNIDLRLRPNAGLRTPALFPRFSSDLPGYIGSRMTTPWSLRMSLATLGTDRSRESAKFQEFRDLRDGSAAGVEAHYRSGNQFFDLAGRHLGLADQDLTLGGGRAGQYVVTLNYDQTPHRYAFDAPSLYAGAGTGELTISDRTQSDLQASTTTQDAAGRIRSVVDQGAQAGDLGLRRQRIGLDFALLASYPFTIRASVNNESRDGVLPFNGSFGFGNFADLPWPVAYDTRDVRLSADYARPESRLFASGSYRLSLFDNHIGALKFDNPYRITDSIGSGPFATGPSTGLIGLPPSNAYQEVSVSSVLNRLPRQTSLSGLVSMGFLRQNDRLLPFSTNTSIVPGVPTNPPFNATDLASLPRPTAETAMNTALAQLRFGTRPVNRLRLVTQYRYFNLDNNETPFTIPAFVSVDSSVRFPRTAGGAFQTLLSAYNRHTASVEGNIDLVGDTGLGLSYTFERMNRDFREVAWMNDHRVKVSLDTRAAAWLDLKTSYQRSVRDTSDYIFNQYNVRQDNPLESPMLPSLRKYDEAARRRDDVQVMATVQPGDAFSLSGSVLYGRDDYSTSAFGLKRDTHSSYSADASYVLSELVSVYASYTFERFDAWQKARQWSPDNAADPYTRETGLDSNSNWEAFPLDNIHTVGAGLEASLIPNRLRLDVAYSYSITNGEIRYFSPVGTAADDVNAFEPAPFNTVDDTKYHSFNPELELRLGGRLTLTAAYYLEKWTIRDFQYDGFTTTPRNLTGGLNAGLLTGGLLFPNYNVNVFVLRLNVGL